MHSKLPSWFRQEKVDAVLVTNKTNIRYFSNFTGSNGLLVLMPKKSFLFTDFRYHLVAKKVLPRWISLVNMGEHFAKSWQMMLAKNRIRAMGFESGSISHQSFLASQKRSQGVTWKDVGASLAGLRMEKTVEELRNIRQAQHITDEIFTMLKRKLRTGMSEQHIGWLVESFAHELGAEDISFPPIIGINEHSASPHHQNSPRKLKKGDLVLIDMGVIFKGYCSDMTRMLFSRPLSSFEHKIYSIVLKAQEESAKKLKAGVIGSTIDAVARGIIQKEGFGKVFGHSLGHGVGLDIHELPNLAEKYEKPIPENAVVTVEPGIYLEGKFGVRLEDMMHVKLNGAVNLTKSPKAIQECRISLE